MKNMMKQIALAILAMAITGNVGATILTFNDDTGGVLGANGSAIPQAYGDNVTALTQAGFGYGVGIEGFTPNVRVDYGTVANPAMFNLNFWDLGYGNLTNIGWSGPFTQINLTNTGPNLVGLYSLDMATFGPDSLGTVTISDENDVVLYSSGSVTFSGTTHTAFDFSSSPLTADVIKIGLTGVSGFYGIDNIRFGEIIPVPEPSVGCLVGLAGWLALQRRRRGSNPRG